MKDWEGMAFPKNPRIKNQKLIDKKQHICEKCGKQGWTNKHHITSKGASGGDTEENLIELCGKCHRLVHDGLIERKELKSIVKRRKKHE